MAEVAVTEWGLEASAADLVAAALDEAVRRSPTVGRFVAQLESGTSTTLINWVDHLCGPFADEELRRAGFVDGYQTARGIWRHPAARYPALVPDRRWSVGIRVDDVTAFAAALGSAAPISGSPRSGLRHVVVDDGEVRLFGIERRSWSCGLDAEQLTPTASADSTEAWRTWEARTELLGHDPRVEQLVAIAQRLVDLAGEDRAASYFLEQARTSWEARNRAGIVQRGRQDALGLGWGNRDHHTFRSSRGSFSPLLRLFATFGFTLREPFYPGASQHWAAQVLEHRGTADVIFTDVDLAPGSTRIDLDAAPPPTTELGTIGLWCALHGESILQAGMHHLAAEFDFDRLRVDLSALGIDHMAPFSELPYLRQAFTEPEHWPVQRARLEALVAERLLTPAEAEAIRTNGGVGSHLENIAREQGFKGFNSRNIADALSSTDPRRPRTD